jgi:hypothetical protein
MGDLNHDAVEAWAMQSKLRAFLFLLGLGAFISVGLLAGANVLAKIAEPDFLHAVAAHRP